MDLMISEFFENSVLFIYIDLTKPNTQKVNSVISINSFLLTSNPCSENLAGISRYKYGGDYFYRPLQLNKLNELD